MLLAGFITSLPFNSVQRLVSVGNHPARRDVGPPAVLHYAVVWPNPLIYLIPNAGAAAAARGPPSTSSP